MQLDGTLKKIRANYSRSLAESSRLRAAVNNQRFIVNHLTNQFGSGFSAAELPSQRKAPFTTPPPANKPPPRKKQCVNPYSKAKTNFDDVFADTSKDYELAKALQDAENSTATTNATKTESKSLGEEVANRKNSEFKEGAKTSGETPADYADLTSNRGSGDAYGKPMNDGASV